MYKTDVKQILRFLFFGVIIFSIASSSVEAAKIQALEKPIDESRITIHVPEDYPTIQEAIDAAVDGDTVLVNDGTYEEAINFLGKAITVISVNGPEVTIIDSGPLVGLNTPVTFNSGENSLSVLEGFTITCNQEYTHVIDCIDGSSPTIKSNIITRNGSLAMPAIYCNNSANPVIENNLITNNALAISCYDSSPQIENNFILCNSSHGINITGNSSAQIIENIICGNIGRAIQCYDVGNDLMIKNNTIISNGYGIFCNVNASPSIINNIIVGNSKGVDCYQSSPIIDFNDVWDNHINYDDCTAGPNDISVDPLFEAYVVNVTEGESIQKAINDILYLLGENSPCIGAGENGVNIGAYPEQNNYEQPGEFIITVEQGLYQETMQFPSYIQLIGEGAEITILDADNEDTVVCIVGSAEVVVQGFTIQNGSQEGILCEMYSQPLISNNIITGNDNYGIRCHDHSNVTITKNRIISNEGIGIYLDGPYGSAEISHNMIAENGEDGIECHDAVDGYIEMNIIIDNGACGILNSWHGSSIVTNNVISYNAVDGIYIADNSYSSSNFNNIISGNGRYGIGCDGYWWQYIDFDYNDVWNNTNGNYGGYAQPGLNDISEDPLFIDPEGYFRLHSNSPCIDAGIDVGLPFLGDAPDMGRYEYYPGQPYPHIIDEPMIG